ncbi:SLAP domain-containing protein [Virgibacillus byunsanensis]|uniref:SLAP domain-containing protein n=1 Tax=Virgibacillus byunsanensis TaxID=570945 RepID=A0ABW3LP62_9BACI
MQKLQFESAWDKTVSKKHRKIIEDAFASTEFLLDDSIQVTSLWQALNHKGNLLVTTLVHNTTQQSFSFQNTKLRYVEDNLVIAEHTFTIPAFVVEPKTSIPWTFIFPKESLVSSTTFQDGDIEIVKEEKSSD